MLVLPVIQKVLEKIQKPFLQEKLLSRKKIRKLTLEKQELDYKNDELKSIMKHALLTLDLLENPKKGPVDEKQLLERMRKLLEEASKFTTDENEE